MYALLDNDGNKIGEAPKKRACQSYRGFMVLNALIEGQSFDDIIAIQKYKIIKTED